MHKLNALLATTALTGLAGAMTGPAAFADSSGNFNATVAETQCTLNTNTGALGGGLTGTMLTTTITTPNGSGTTLLITPSFVTGLFTNTQITKAMQSSSETAAVQVFVKLDGEEVPPATDGHPGITYDERFQQLSSNVFNQLVGGGTFCSFTTSVSLTSISPSVTTTTTLTIGTVSCSIDLILSTMSAHSFNFVASPPQLSGGNHSLEVDWALVCANNGGSLLAANCATTFAANTAAACIGPGTVTVQQVKNFHNDGSISIGP
jgi:hypothetical protein